MSGRKYIIDDDLLDVVPARNYCRKHAGLTTRKNKITGGVEVVEWRQDCDCKLPKQKKAKK